MGCQIILPILWLACFMNSLLPLCSILLHMHLSCYKLNYLHSSPYPSKLILQSQSVAYLLLRLCSNWRVFFFFAICLRCLVYNISLFLALCSLLSSTPQRRLYLNSWSVQAVCVFCVAMEFRSKLPGTNLVLSFCLHIGKSFSFY